MTQAVMRRGSTRLGPLSDRRWLEAAERVDPARLL